MCARYRASCVKWAMSNTTVREVLVANRQGIHMRPATAIINLANTFQCEIEISNGERAVNGKSIMELLTLSVTGHGADAERAVCAIVELIEGRFGEK